MPPPKVLVRLPPEIVNAVGDTGGFGEPDVLTRIVSPDDPQLRPRGRSAERLDQPGDALPLEVVRDRENDGGVVTGTHALPDPTADTGVRTETGDVDTVRNDLDELPRHTVPAGEIVLHARRGADDERRR